MTKDKKKRYKVTVKGTEFSSRFGPYEFDELSEALVMVLDEAGAGAEVTLKIRAAE